MKLCTILTIGAAIAQHATVLAQNAYAVPGQQPVVRQLNPWGGGNTKSPTTTPTSSPVKKEEVNAAAAGTQQQKVSIGDVSFNIVQDSDFVTFDLTIKSETWISVGIGSDNNNKMVGSKALIYKPAENSVNFYAIPSTTGSEFTVEAAESTFESVEKVQANGETKMVVKTNNFNELLKNGETIIIAYGDDNNFGYHGENKLKVDVELVAAGDETPGGSDGLENVISDGRVVAHVVLMILSWGILIPFGVLSALLKGPSPQTPAWFNRHRYANSLGALLSIVGIVLMIIRGAEAKIDHFRDPHFVIGFVVLLFSVLQVVGGLMRPPKSHGEYEEKSSKRKQWELFHRLLGSATAVLALVNLILGANLLFGGAIDVALFGEGSSISNSASKAMIITLVVLDILAFAYGATKRYSEMEEDADELALKNNNGRLA